MTTPTELSEAHLQDHELISAALAASSLSSEASSSTLPPFLTSAPQTPQLETEDAMDSSEAQSPALHSPDLLTTPRTDSSRPLSSPPNIPILPTSSHDQDSPGPRVELLQRKATRGYEKPRGSVTFGDAVNSGRGELADSTDGLAGEADESERSERSDISQSKAVPGQEVEDSLDPVLRAALNHHRDRFLLLRAEVEMERFLGNPSMTRLPLAPPYFQPALNSYQRLLVHRLADTFGITREVEAAPPTIWNAGAINPATGQPQGVVVLVKGENTRFPPAKLATYVPAPEVPAPIPSTIAIPSPSSTPSIASSPITSAPPSASTSSLPNLVDPATASSQPPTTPQILKILPRSSASRTASSASSSIGTDDDPATSSSAPPSAKGKNRKELTLEEREAAYKEARERIFSQPEQERAASQVAPSSSSVASEDVGSRLASVGAGITRPSSAGSTFSRSSAALSVAGGRPSPSIVSESGSSMWSGHHGGIYGGGSQLMPLLRPSAPSFDPSMQGGWTPEYANYAQDLSWQQQQQHFQQQQGYPNQSNYSPHPPIQVTAPPSHSPYAASSPSYASSSTSSFSGPIPPPPFPPSQQHYQPVDAWGRAIPPSLPSPSLSNSSGSSMQQPLHHHHASSSSTTTSERSTSANSGYLMRFADSGAVVTPGGTVTAGPPNFSSPSSSMFVGPPSTARSVSSFSSNSQQSSHNSGGTSRTAASSSAAGTGSRTGKTGSTGSQVRRQSGSLASSVSSARSAGERKVSLTGGSDAGSGSSGEVKKRDRQTTIVGRETESPEAEKEEEEESTESPSRTPASSTSLHPSLPAKPVWIATKPPRARTPPPPVPSSSTTEHSSKATPPSFPTSQLPAASYASRDGPPTLHHPYQPQQQPPPQPAYSSYPISTNSQPPFYPQPTQSFSPAPPSNPSQPGQPLSWSRPSGIHYPAAPSFSQPSSTGNYPIQGGGYPVNLPPSNWTYAHPSMPPAPPIPPQQQPSSGGRSQDNLPFPDIRRPPPKSTQLFDPNRPNAGGGGGGNAMGIRRGGSGPGSARSISSTRGAILE